MYLPVLKNRTVEFNVLKQLYQIPISKNVIPLIEIIQEKIQSNSSIPLVEEVHNTLNRTTHPFMIDLIKTNIPNNIMPAIRDFLTKVNRNREFYLDVLKSFNIIENAIPVISYNNSGFNVEDIIDDTRILRDIFPILAFRLFSGSFSSVFPEIRKLLNKSDYLILDIGSASHINPAIKKLYMEVNKNKRDIGFQSIIINSNKAKEITNKGLENGEPIFDIDNSLRDSYKNYSFDGFGDFACVSNELPSSGGTISPAGIYYSFDYNFFIGFRRNRELSEFEEFIAPSIVASEYWNEFSEEHHRKCPGCRTILNIIEKTEMGKSQAKWKGITMSHYIYTMSERLQ